MLPTGLGKKAQVCVCTFDSSVGAMLQDLCCSLCADKSRQLCSSGPSHLSLKGKSQLFYSKNLPTCWQLFLTRGHAFSWIHNFPGILDSDNCLPRIQVDFFQLLELYAVNIWRDRKWDSKVCGVTAPTLRYNLEFGVGHHTIIKNQAHVASAEKSEQTEQIEQLALQMPELTVAGFLHPCVLWLTHLLQLKLFCVFGT